MRILLNDIEVTLLNETLEINSANPFLENEEERLDNIFSIEVPITGNEKALNYANNIDAIIGDEFTCEVISDVNFMGVAIITEVSNENNTATIQIGYAKSNFNYLIKDKKMKEIDFGQITCADKVSLQTTPWAIPAFVSNNNGVKRYLLSFNYVSGNSNYINSGYLHIAENNDVKVNFRINLYFNYPGYPSSNQVKIYSKKNNEAERLITDSGSVLRTEAQIELMMTFNVDGASGDIIRIFIDSETGDFLRIPRAYLECSIFDKDFVYEANSDENANYCFPLIHNKEMMSQLPNGTSKSFYTDKYPLLNNVFTLEKRFYKTENSIPYTKLLAPCLKVSYILKQIFANLDYTLNKIRFDSIYNSLLSFTGTIIGDYKSSNTNFYIDLPTEFQLNKCFENNVLISDFLHDLFVITGFFPLFNHELKSVKLISINDLFENITTIEAIVINDTINYDKSSKGISVEISTGNDNHLNENYNSLEDFNSRGEIPTLADVPVNIELDDCFFIASERKYYAYSFGKANETATTNSLFWKFISYDFRLEEEKGEETFVKFKSETPILVGTTTSVLGDGTPTYQDLNIPITQQSIRVNKAYETYKNDYSNSFLINRGMRTKAGLGEYVYASADNYFGQSKFTDISLRVDGDEGIMNRCYENLYRIYSKGKKHTITAYMKASEIRKLTYENLIEIDNSVNMLISYSYKLTDSEYMEIELELIKI